MKFNNGYGRKACAAGLALATALAMVPSVAFGASLDNNTGDITIRGLGNGDTVTAYEILDRDVDQKSNNVTDKFIKNTGVSQTTFQGLTSDGSVYSKGSAMQLAADTIANAIKTGKATALNTQTAKAVDGVATIKDAPAGEWLILVTSADHTVTKVYQNTIVSNAPEAKDGTYKANDADATIKATDETVKKGVGTTRQDAQDAKTSDGQYGIGDLVPFVIDTIIPDYPADSTNRTFTVGDAPDPGLDIDQNTIKVYTVDATGSETEVAASNYTASVADRNMTVNFTDDFIKQNPGQEILVKYQAKLTSAAKVTTDKVTQNSATITFNPNPYETGTSTPGTHTDVKTYGVFFVKKGDGAALPGAKFQIKYKDGAKAGQYVMGDDGKPLSSTSDNNGYVWFEDLAKGEYTLEEVSAPTGYQKVADFDVDLTNGGTADNPATTDVTEANYVQYNKENGVTDPKVGMLPTTGDAGTIGLTAAGILLVAGSAFVVIGHNRRAKDEEK